jgi:hypothetical protein
VGFHERDGLFDQALHCDSGIDRVEREHAVQAFGEAVRHQVHLTDEPVEPLELETRKVQTV